MEIHSLQDIEKALSETRKEFNKTTYPIKGTLDRAISLFLEAISLVRTVAKDTDDERYALEVLATAFRRVVASVVLLESGLPPEAHMVLRNALELMLIAIDITYNGASLEEWKKTIKDGLKDYDEWYFTKRKICTRIDKNEGSVYPELERKLALHIEDMPGGGNGICREWEIISNISVHAHSQAQIRKLFDSGGSFQLLGRKTVENYGKDFKQYRVFIFNTISLLIGIPRYRDLFNKSKQFAEKYSKLQKEIGITPETMEENIMKVRLVDSEGKEIGVSIELGKTLAELGAKAKAEGEAGGDFGKVITKMLHLLVANRFEVTKLKAIVTFVETESGAKIEDITLYYVD